MTYPAHSALTFIDSNNRNYEWRWKLVKTLWERRLFLAYKPLGKWFQTLYKQFANVFQTLYKLLSNALQTPSKGFTTFLQALANASQTLSKCFANTLQMPSKRCLKHHLTQIEIVDKTCFPMEGPKKLAPMDMSGEFPNALQTPCKRFQTLCKPFSNALQTLYKCLPNAV